MDLREDMELERRRRTNTLLASQPLGFGLTAASKAGWCIQGQPPVPQVMSDPVIHTGYCLFGQTLNCRSFFISMFRLRLESLLMFWVL